MKHYSRYNRLLPETLCHMWTLCQTAPLLLHVISLLQSSTVSLQHELILSYYCQDRFKFTLNPPCSIAHENLFSAIWNTSHWNFLATFEHKTLYNIFWDCVVNFDIYVHFWLLQCYFAWLGIKGSLSTPPK